MSAMLLSSSLYLRRSTSWMPSQTDLMMVASVFSGFGDPNVVVPRLRMRLMVPAIACMFAHMCQYLRCRGHFGAESGLSQGCFDAQMVKTFTESKPRALFRSSLRQGCGASCLYSPRRADSPRGRSSFPNLHLPRIRSLRTLSGCVIFLRSDAN